jgi:hypothetical protein
MGANAIAFSRALGLNKMDVLGFSIGGMWSRRKSRCWRPISFAS